MIVAVLCVCGTGGGNTGVPSCFPFFDVTKQLILTEYYKTDGTINGIDLSTLVGDIFTQADLDARVKDIDPRTRWYPTPELKNITDERSDDIVEEFEDSSKVFIQEGARSFEGMSVRGNDPVFLGNMKKWRCQTLGYYQIDKSGNLIGAFNRPGWLDPILVQDDSFSASLIRGTDTTKQKVSIKFDVSQLEDDADLRMIQASDITANLLGVGGLLDVVAETPTSITTTGFDVQLNTLFGSVNNPIPAEGLQLADFSMAEISPTPGPIVITSVTESTTVPGLYTFVIPAQTSGDLLRVSNPLAGPLSKNFDLTPFDVNIP